MQSLQVNGEVTARSGDAATVEGGRLSVRFNGLPAEAYKGEATAAVPSPAFTDYFSADRVLTLGGTPAALPLLGAPFEAAQSGRGQLGTGLFADGGFDSIWVASANTVATAGSLTLAPRASLTIDAQALRVAPDTTLSIRTPGAVALGSQQATGTFAPNLDAAASGGNGRLAVEARSVELVGRSVLQGVGQTEIRAADDVQLRGVDPTGARVGGALTSGGDLRIAAAQLTPATQTDFRIAVTDTTAGRIRIEPTAGAVPLAPLSAGGSVALSAPLIDVTGRITAPHGAIDLDAGERLTIGPTATLSVAGSQAVPFGTVFNGSQWVYSSVAPDVDDTSLVLADGNGVTLLDKRIRLKGATVGCRPRGAARPARRRRPRRPGVHGRPRRLDRCAPELRGRALHTNQHAQPAVRADPGARQPGCAVRPDDPGRPDAGRRARRQQPAARRPDNHDRRRQRDPGRHLHRAAGALCRAARRLCAAGGGGLHRSAARKRGAGRPAARRSWPAASAWPGPA